VEWIEGFGKSRRLSNSGIIPEFAWRDRRTERSW